jgi:hypothetical protein
MTQSDEQDKIEKEIRRERRFNMASALSEAGSDFLKGGSPVPLFLQSVSAITALLNQHLKDTEGALKETLIQVIRSENTIIGSHSNNPALALKEIVQNLLQSPSRLKEFVRRCDMQWGKNYGERPIFEKPNQPAHPADPYTLESVKQQLEAMLKGIDKP